MKSDQMGMRRVFYMGQESCFDTRIGLDLHPGYAFDCPEPMALALLREPCFAESGKGPLVPDKPGSSITWYEPPPGQELLVLKGVGPKVSEAMVAQGIGYLSDLLALDELGIEALANSLKGVPVDLVRAWVDQARQY